MAYQIDHGAAGKLCNAVWNLRALTSKEHHKVTAERARASGENPWAKMGVTGGRACEWRKVGEDEWTRCASREEASRQTGVSRGVICEHLNSKTAMALGKRTAWTDDGVRNNRVDHCGYEFRDLSTAVQKPTPSMRPDSLGDSHTGPWSRRTTARRG